MQIQKCLKFLILVISVQWLPLLMAPTRAAEDSDFEDWAPEAGMDEPLPMRGLSQTPMNDLLKQSEIDPELLLKRQALINSKAGGDSMTDADGVDRPGLPRSESRLSADSAARRQQSSSIGQPELSLEMIDSQREMERALQRERERNERSTVETIFSGRFPSQVSRRLEQFGYNLFNRSAESFTALENIPISADYIMGPGDVFTVNVWGANSLSRKVTVRRDGTIFIPKVGTVKVVGQTYAEMTQAIEKRITRLMSGVRVSFSFESIRSIEVMLVGEVEKPGSYQVASTSSPINALFYGGGIKKTGSLRSIKVVRGGKEIATVDLYDFLIKGSSTSLRLQSQDVVLVPVIGPVAALAGNIKRPAIYELKADSRLHDLLMMGGGLSFSGHAGRLSLERVVSNKERVTRDIMIPENLATLSAEEISKSPLSEVLMDGDFVRVFPVLDIMAKTVYLRGHVKRPGPYEFRPGLKVADLLKSFEALKPEPYTDYLQIIRVRPPKDEKSSLFVNLEKALGGDSAHNIELQDRDQVVVFSKDELNLRERVTISGRVNKPGEYLHFEGMRLRDLIYMAGNLTQDAYLANAEIARYSIENNQLKFDRFQVNLQSLLNQDDGNNPELMPKDNVLIQGIPNFELNNFLVLEGEVKFPGRYSFSRNERLSSVIRRAGGFSDKAFLPGSIFTRESVRRIQERNLEEQISRLEEAILQESLNPRAVRASEDAASSQEALAARRALLKNLERSEVSGRMVIRVTPLENFERSRFDIPLEAGDKLFIPQVPSTVTVTGEVYNPTSLVFVDNRSVQHYLDQTGGLTMNADSDSVFVIRADGSVISKRQNRGFLLRSFYRTTIERGDTIFVPKDISRFSPLDTAKDITEILFKIASTTGITITALR